MSWDSSRRAHVPRELRVGAHKIAWPFMYMYASKGSKRRYSEEKYSRKGGTRRPGSTEVQVVP